MRRTVSAVLFMLAALTGTLTLLTHLADTATYPGQRTASTFAALLETGPGRTQVAGEVTDLLRQAAPGLPLSAAQRLGALVAADRALADIASSSAAGPTDPVDLARALYGRVVEVTAAHDARAANRLDAWAARQGPEAPQVVAPVLGEHAEQVHLAAGAVTTFGTSAALTLTVSAILLGPARDRLAAYAGLALLTAAALIGMVAWLLPFTAAWWADGRVPVLIDAGLRASRAELTDLLAVLAIAGVVIGAVGLLLARGPGRALPPAVTSAIRRARRSRAESRQAARLTREAIAARAVPATSAPAFDPFDARVTGGERCRPE